VGQVSVTQGIVEDLLVTDLRIKSDRMRLSHYTLISAENARRREMAKRMLAELTWYEVFNFHFRFTRAESQVSHVTPSPIM
jgi:hypothetical protein